MQVIHHLSNSFDSTQEENNNLHEMCLQNTPHINVVKVDNSLEMSRDTIQKSKSLPITSTPKEKNRERPKKYYCSDCGRVMLCLHCYNNSSQTDCELNDKATPSTTNYGIATYKSRERIFNRPGLEDLFSTVGVRVSEKGDASCNISEVTSKGLFMPRFYLTQSSDDEPIPLVEHKITSKNKTDTISKECDTISTTGITSCNESPITNQNESPRTDQKHKKKRTRDKSKNPRSAKNKKSSSSSSSNHRHGKHTYSKSEPNTPSSRDSSHTKKRKVKSARDTPKKKSSKSRRSPTVNKDFELENMLSKETKNYVIPKITLGENTKKGCKRLDFHHDRENINYSDVQNVQVSRKERDNIGEDDIQDTNTNTNVDIQTLDYDDYMLNNMHRVKSLMTCECDFDVTMKKIGSRSTPSLSLKNRVESTWELSRCKSMPEQSPEQSNDMTIAQGVDTFTKHTFHSREELKEEEKKYVLSALETAIKRNTSCVKPSMGILDKGMSTLCALYDMDPRYIFMINGTFTINGKTYQPTESLVFNVYFGDHQYESFALLDIDVKKFKKRFYPKRVKSHSNAIAGIVYNKSAQQQLLTNGITPVLRYRDGSEISRDFFSLVPHVVVRNPASHSNDIFAPPNHDNYVYKFNKDHHNIIYKTNVSNKKLHFMICPNTSVFSVIKRADFRESLEVMDNSNIFWTNDEHWTSQWSLNIAKTYFYSQ